MAILLKFHLFVIHIVFDCFFICGGTPYLYIFGNLEKWCVLQGMQKSLT